MFAAGHPCIMSRTWVVSMPVIGYDTFHQILSSLRTAAACPCPLPFGVPAPGRTGAVGAPKGLAPLGGALRRSYPPQGIASTGDRYLSLQQLQNLSVQDRNKLSIERQFDVAICREWIGIDFHLFINPQGCDQITGAILRLKGNGRQLWKAFE